VYTCGTVIVFMCILVAQLSYLCVYLWHSYRIYVYTCGTVIVFTYIHVLIAQLSYLRIYLPRNYRISVYTCRAIIVYRIYLPRNYRISVYTCRAIIVFPYTGVQYYFHIRWCSCDLTVTGRVSLVEQEMLTLSNHTSSPPVLSEFVLLNL
jgi:hypothetical protein